MSRSNFYLKKAEKSGLSLIYLQLTYSKRKMIFTFDQVIDPKHWDKKKQRIKQNTQTIKDGLHGVNALLDDLEERAIVIYREAAKTNSIPDPIVLRRQLRHYIDGTSDSTVPSFLEMFDKIIGNEIKFRGKDRTANTLKAYRTTKAHLIEFHETTGYPLSYDSVGFKFHNAFVSFLRSTKGLNENSIGKDIKNVKSVMSKAFALKYTTNEDFRDKENFAKPSEETDSVCLFKDELLKLYQFDFSGFPELETARDLFVFGCHCGLRYSDLSELKPENFITRDEKTSLRVKTKKTKDQLTISLPLIAVRILKKYNARLPKISDGDFNERIKSLSYKAGFTECGRLKTKPYKPLWEALSSKSMRSSYATNLFLAGVPSAIIRKMTGHKTLAAFERYIRIDELNADKYLHEYYKNTQEQE